jgi:hypothetical protein
MTEVSIEDLKELASLVRCGRIYDVQPWLATGRPFRAITEIRINPILDGVHIGFHGMVEAFLLAGLNPEELTDVLSEGVNAHHEDLVKLLIDQAQTFGQYHLRTCFTSGIPTSSGCSLNTGQTSKPAQMILNDFVIGGIVDVSQGRT